MIEWQRVRLDECCSIVGGATPSTSVAAYWDGDICWATPKDLSNLEGAHIADTPRKVTKEGLASCAADVLPAGSVLFSSRAPIGHVALNTVPMATNQGFKSFLPKPELLHAKFLYHWLRRNRPYLESLGNGATFKEVSKAVVSRIEIGLPLLSEQRRIADVLDRAEALRARRRAALAHVDTLTQSIFLEMFGDPATNPKGWPRLALTDAVVGKYGIKAGPFGSSLKKEDYTISGYRVYGQEQVIAGRFDIGDYYIGESKYQQLKSCAVKVGDLLVSLVGSFGKVLVVPPGIEPGIINPRLLKITPDHRLLTSGFLAAFLSLPIIQGQLARMSHGGTMGILNAGLLKQLAVVLPPLALQCDFGGRTHDVQKLKVAHRASLTELDALFASLQHRAFRGEL